MKKINEQHGFTLVELAIVLVIIGLIVGGVLVGKSLIDAAMIRSQIAQLEGYNTAVSTFRLKYHGMPGDIRKANSFFDTASWLNLVNGKAIVCLKHVVQGP